MNTQLHPTYAVSQVTCSCGNTFETRSTVDSIHVENCSACHPFYTGVQKATAVGGRVERFRARAARASQSAVAVA